MVGCLFVYSAAYLNKSYMTFGFLMWFANLTRSLGIGTKMVQLIKKTEANSESWRERERQRQTMTRAGRQQKRRQRQLMRL